MILQNGEPARSLLMTFWIYLESWKKGSTTVARSITPTYELYGWKHNLRWPSFFTHHHTHHCSLELSPPIKWSIRNVNSASNIIINKQCCRSLCKFHNQWMWTHRVQNKALFLFHQLWNNSPVAVEETLRGFSKCSSIQINETSGEAQLQ